MNGMLHFIQNEVASIQFGFNKISPRNRQKKTLISKLVITTLEEGRRRFLIACEEWQL